MNKTLRQLTVIVLLILSGNSVVLAQTIDYRWGVGIHGGYTRMNDDFDNYYFKTDQQQKFGGLSLSTFVSPHFSAALTLLNGDLSTFNKDINRKLQSTLRSGDLSLLYKFFPEEFIVRPYISLGAGLLYVDNYIKRGQYSPVLVPGLGIRVAATPRIHFDLSAHQYTSFLDKIDGADGGTYTDSYITYSAGVIFNLGKLKDSDGDKVGDNMDDCPGTKAGVKVTRMGCPLDSDEDGILNVFDQCPEVKGLAKFGGCPDTDGDSIEDIRDNCPDLAGPVKFNGCPDSDGDGIEDSKDLCPNASGIAQFKGCPDTDKDGIEDSKDKCPNVAGIAAFEGCTDTDKDGIPDHLDRCPEASGSSKMDGCPDTDGDGVEDSKDRCISVPGLPAYGGCPAPKTADMKKLEAIAKKINFENGKSILKPASSGILDQVVTLMKANPSYKLSVEGHTDNVGSSAKNLELSQQRAEAVKMYLVNKGIDADRIVAAGFGDSKPISDNKTAKGKALNRRSELKLF